MNQKHTLNALKKLAESDASIEVVWLYGSRAKGTADADSDFDLAIAFQSLPENRASYFTEDLAFQWMEQVNVKISIVDINQIPIPLAYNIIEEGEIIMSANPLRIHSEQSRVWSLWEEYRYEYLKNRA
ncbi:type VII toxin-antitoxin system MntA family adenylyltransferase antitoxin [Oceanospirillum linum]|uniref:Polymerase beta nucleotidyltransferase domain-containing protein n=1 Tax=Oceanospirillum linum TaxID=966 RepID=A0A1T1HC88_OCELI|nr:nucleotidyltransferase domain-containing protein [Oceanospirillum linum]OOV87471.1 hypothetical protein BTA35_0205345 [Oceanospirillum linum]SEF88954.1 Nucleotidyltransferase domain-containing protein [Oleiphilus messinensis]SMP13659.1 Nucleotidyltransferase domain-containing protein [Oceanospirillum linum]